ncbi:hypothetical protein EMIHUDRAFT_221043 [Emiliania huxleyi CCMP1516]|uniref:Uncharacterized protein n=2 Tax=Emiliania huxleyi TaxID=2903 RepID=A0A0D3HZW3_EMIH1|nr:hypothetical protein EMIHUDRAFT_221043 [Emiliania huxleyi CCMP1516]EOD04548.1 hypothetical protein EMIHUDRAFT_221043 [Emiliania huxleyi CCMP1516]|eukprot:XP_005756977.1 hypothetical protein EMIHUDRAFT_221043 [Emiliania huxleyi CCMP1516]
MMANLDKPPRNESVSSMHDWTQRNTEYPSSDGGSVSPTDSVGATLWNWANGRSTGPSAQTTPATSRDASVDGGGQFAGGTLPGGAGGIPSVASNSSLWNWRDYSSSHGGMPRNSSASRLWAFGQGAGRSPTTSPPVSREASAHAGSELRGLGAMRLSVPGTSHGTTGSPAPLAIPGRHDRLAGAVA